MARRPQRRKSKRRFTESGAEQKKKAKSIRSRPAKKSKDYYVAQAAPARENELKRRAKQVGAHILDVAENDPERFIEGLERAAKGVEALYAFFRTNPVEARKTLRNAAIAAAAKAAKTKLAQN